MSENDEVQISRPRYRAKSKTRDFCTDAIERMRIASLFLLCLTLTLNMV